MRARRMTTSTSTTSQAGTDEELITPAWRSDKFEQAARTASLWTMAAQLPDTARYLFRLAWNHFPGTVAVVLATNIISGLASGYGLYSTTTVLRELLTAGPTPQRLLAALPAIGIVVGALALQRLTDAIGQYGVQKIAVRLEREAEDKVVHAATHIPLAAYDEPTWYDGLELAFISGTTHVAGAFTRLVTALGSLTGLVAIAGTLVFLDPVLVPLLVASVLPDAWAALSVARLLYDSIRRLAPVRRRRSMITRLPRNEDAAPEIRAYRAQPFLQTELARFGDVLEREEIALAKHQTRTRLIGRAAGGLGLGLAYGALGLLLFTGRIPIAVAGGALIAIQSGRSRLSDIVMAVNRLYEEGLYVGAYRQFLDESSARTPSPTGVLAPPTPQVYRLDNVSFTYPGASKPSLTDICLEIRRGERVAFAGLNGGGKTTLAKVLAGLYQATSGHVLRDGVDLAAVDAGSAFDGISMVMQDPIHWPTSLATNIRIGRPDLHDPDDELLRWAAEASGSDEVAAQAPFGWDTMLSKQFVRGTRLSGGQEQRVAIGRALYRRAPLIIADEPSSSLDARAEARTYAALAALPADQTIVLITHRMASVRMCDRIYVLDEGRIIAHGSHQELMRLGPGSLYHDLYQTQADSYHDSEPDAGGEALRATPPRNGHCASTPGPS